MITLTDVKIGEEVWHDGDSSFCTLSKLTVTDIKTKYNVDTGEPYKVIFCGSLGFYADTGSAIDNMFYYITPIED